MGSTRERGIMDLPRKGALVEVIHIAETRWGDSVHFGTIDGDNYYGVPEDAKPGDILTVSEDGRSWPISASRSWVIQLSKDLTYNAVR